MAIYETSYDGPPLHRSRHRWLLFIPLLVVVAWIVEMLIMGH